MSPFPKPRGFWDYALFALALTGALFFLFWMEARDKVSWPDAALAFGAAVLCVLAIILARRNEKARWIAHPTWHFYPLASLGACGLLFGTIYADAYLLHPSEINSSWIRLNTSIVIAMMVVMSLSFLRQYRSKR
jgi:threonine/homoserine efflux transporter RhtA